ncbi:transcriptional regulator, TetR family [Leptospira fainei serovar Hurstbridge str. BUT 6]|uniref:Transcriptional regulator, TetR family n=1 Tax=Leptospira fainei serovar Hurstbridge str. BUT 6 TaxID=1193011 RepID=S3V2S1_9LEPT|nr:TetR/AcrR family transcriptional regulator [Leptospira fainei]EPG74929.1 transcriptional regulator, TetR family [Leptospira fainei serovar Hurstbridge str. BUT 6]
MKPGIRTPVQTRSRERVELILRTARDLIGEKGIDAVSMREIAQASGIQIGSLYQYFPGKNQLLLTIMNDYYDRLYEGTKSILEPVRNVSELEVAAETAFAQFIRFFQEDPALANLWAGARAIPELIIEDIRDTYRNAALFVKITLRCLPGLRESDVQPFALHFAHTIGSVIRFAAEIDPNHSKAVLHESRVILSLRLQALQELSKTRKSNKSRKLKT